MAAHSVTKYNVRMPNLSRTGSGQEWMERIAGQSCPCGEKAKMDIREYLQARACSSKLETKEQIKSRRRVKAKQKGE
jgi:hypothetical protein